MRDYDNDPNLLCLLVRRLFLSPDDHRIHCMFHPKVGPKKNHYFECECLFAKLQYSKQSMHT